MSNPTKFSLVGKVFLIICHLIYHNLHVMFEQLLSFLYVMPSKIKKQLQMVSMEHCDHLPGVNTIQFQNLFQRSTFLKHTYICIQTSYRQKYKYIENMSVITTFFLLFFSNQRSANMSIENEYKCARHIHYCV